jgi:pimeloyl-ACP methyl ester carboxylesterase
MPIGAQVEPPDPAVAVGARALRHSGLMTESRVDRLLVPGASLFYKMRGTGPLLFMLQGGDGDAESTDALADRLVDRYTILTYDRRGLSRSPLDPAVGSADLATHSGDAARLLAEVTDEPALVFGTSLGALLGLDLIAHHPDRVRRLVAHEPPATELLPERERDDAVRSQEEVEEIYRRDGIGAAMRQFMTISGVNFDDREPDVELPRPKPERIANLRFFLTYDAPAVRRYRLDRPALLAVATRIVPGVGSSSGGSLAHNSAVALAELLGQALVEFPGGHSGFAFRPRAFAAVLDHSLTGSGGHPGA